MASLHDIWRGDIIPVSGLDVSIGRNSFDPPSPVVPLLDIHQRQLVFHDMSHSGVVQFNADQNRLELIPSNSGAQPIVTAVVWDGYDATGGSTLTNSSSTTITIDTERVNTHPDIFVFNGAVANHVQINASGTYEFEFAVSVDSNSSTRSSCEVFMRQSVNGGSTFVAVAGVSAWTYNRTSAAGEDTANAKFILENVQAGYIYGVRGFRLAGADCLTVANGSRLTIKKLA